jgi:type VI secretion system secreted protein Hcp
MAAVDFFLKIEGVEGESTDDKHKKEIDLESWSWGEHQSGTHAGGGGGGAGKVNMQDFSFTKKIDKSSPVLFLRCAAGTHIKEALLTCRKAGGEQQEYMQIKMSDLLVSSYQVTGSSGGGIIPMEQISLNFAKIEYEYKPQKADGSLDAAAKAGWDLKINKKV